MRKRRIFDNDILQVLSEAGDEGLSVRKIARHVFNARHTMFDTLIYEEVHAYIGRYLLRSSKSKKSPIIHAEKRGAYRLKNNASSGIQTTIDFS